MDLRNLTFEMIKYREKHLKLLQAKVDLVENQIFLLTAMFDENYGEMALDQREAMLGTLMDILSEDIKGDAHGE